MGAGAGCIRGRGDLPHPSAHGEPLESEILGVFKDEVANVEYRPEPDNELCIRRPSATIRAQIRNTS